MYKPPDPGLTEIALATIIISAIAITAAFIFVVKGVIQNIKRKVG